MTSAEPPPRRAADMLLIVPTRGRPAAAAELIAAHHATTSGDCDIVLVIDADDPAWPEYDQLDVDSITMARWAPMVDKLNLAAVQAAGRYQALAFMGDDHRPVTAGWDRHYLAALNEPGVGIVYGDDRLRGPELPTQVAMRSTIVKALGYMAWPGLQHLYVDDWWRDLGAAAHCLRYLPDVVVEHRHPLTGRTAWDSQYLRSNSNQQYLRDGAAYCRCIAAQLHTDAATVRAAVEGTNERN